MATINVQAAAAAHVLVDPPPEAAEAIAAIRAASKEGLRELRAVLNVLRQADDQDPVQPTPGLGQLDMLVGTVRRAGLATEVRVVGELPPLPPAVDLAAYRIIQESLTNVLRHAGPATATVELAVRDGGCACRSATPGAAWHRSGGGPRHGLIGMRERAAAVGGTLDAGLARAAASTCARACRWPCTRSRWRRDPGAARRRPGAGPGRVPGAAGSGTTASRWSARRPTASRPSRWPGSARPTSC